MFNLNRTVRPVGQRTPLETTVTKENQVPFKNFMESEGQDLASTQAQIPEVFRSILLQRERCISTET